MRRLTYVDSLGNTITLGAPATGKIKYVIESLVGFDSAPANRFVQKAPYQDGNYHVDTLLGERTITVEGAIYTPKKLTTIMAARRELAQYFNPKLGTGTLTYTYDGGSKIAHVTMAQGPVFANKKATEPFQRFQVTFICNDPWLYDAPTTVTVASAERDWVARTLPSSSAWGAIAYGAGVFVATGGNYYDMATSPDGITWTARTRPVLGNLSSIAYGAGVFVALPINGSTAITSPDGITWTAQTLPSTAYWQAITYGAGLFVAVSGDFAHNSAVAATSPDGITWTAQTLPSTACWQAITYGAGLFVAFQKSVAVSSSNGFATSPDGITWTARTLPSTAYWQAITYGAGLFVAVSVDTSVVTSPDGITWTARVSISGSGWRSIVYGAGVFVAVAYNSSAAATSPDGTVWSSRALPSTAYWSAITFGAGIFAAVAASSSKAASLLSPTSITITGDYATPPVITLDGPVVSPIVISGSFFLMSNRTLIAGEALVIDCSPSAPSIYYRTTAGVLVNDLKNLVLSSTFFQLEKGANSLTFLCNSASVVYSERYLGT